LSWLMVIFGFDIGKSCVLTINKKII